MTLFITYSADKFSIDFNENKFTIFSCEDHFKTNSDSLLYEIEPEEFYANEIVNALDESKYSNIDLIVIDKKLYINISSWNRAVRLAGHIVCHQFKHSSLNDIPIIFTSSSTIDYQELHSLPIANAFAPGIFLFKTYSEIFGKTKNKSLDEEEENIDIILNRQKLNTVKCEQLSIPFVFDNRHQITNEWGAVKLARNAGYKDEEIQYEWPQTLYFKSLTKKYSNFTVTAEQRVDICQRDGKEDRFLIKDKLNFSSHPCLKDKRILLIDDNAHKGWRKALKKIFDRKIDVVTSSNGFIEKCKESNLKQYGLIFLDLYMPLEDGITPNSNYIFQLKILSYLKKEKPEIPIIIFTASNKSWSFDEVIQKGADGVYVKESPEYASDQQYSQENLKSFYTTVANALDKYQVLRPYWESIKDILSSYTTLIENRTHLNYNALFRERIEERLYMFFGLIKRGFEDSNYNKSTFFYSDNVLAFITLWSILNEISDAYYIKRVPTRTNLSLLDKNRKLIDKHPDETQIKSFYDPGEELQVRSQSEYLFKYKYKFEGFNLNGEPRKFNNTERYSIKKYVESNLIFDRDTSPPYRLGISDFNPHKTLHAQIAFLLLTKSSFKDNALIDTYLVKLCHLNNIRNNLYLTHGDELTSGFYSQEEKYKQYNSCINPSGDTKDLFELVAFLLTGKNASITF